MSNFKSTEERLLDLENGADSQAEFHRGLMSALKMMNEATTEIGLAAISMFEAAKNENLVVWRFVQSEVVFVNPAVRQKFLDVLARMETQMEISEARLIEAISKIKKSSSAPSPPEDAPEG